MYTQFQLFHFFVFHVCKFCNHFVLIWHFTNMSFSFCISYRHNAAICYSENLFFCSIYCSISSNFTCISSNFTRISSNFTSISANLSSVSSNVTSISSTLVALAQTLLALPHSTFIKKLHPLQFYPYSFLKAAEFNRYMLG